MNLRSLGTVFFGFAIFAIPFNGMRIGPFGELANELVILPMAGMLAVTVLSGKVFLPPFQVWGSLCLLGLAYLISFLVNFRAISSAEAYGRLGLEKLLSSALVVLYGYTLAYLTYCCLSLGRKTNISRLLLIPLVAITVSLSAVSLLEILARYSGQARHVYLSLAKVLFSGQGYQFLEHRLRSVSFEPPAFAASLGALMVLAFVAEYFSETRNQRVAARTVALVLAGMLLLAGSRLGLVLLLLPIVGTVRKPVWRVAVAVACIAFVIFFSVLFQDRIATVVQEIRTADTTSSNIWRIASIDAGVRMFVQSPLFGIGGGQYGFHVENYLSEWAFESWEVRRAVDERERLLPIYSLHVRILAELGLFGFLIWATSWSICLAKSFGRSEKLYRTAEVMCVYVGIVGLSVGSFRLPGIWIILGLFLWLQKKSPDMSE